MLRYFWWGRDTLASSEEDWNTSGSTQELAGSIWLHGFLTHVVHSVLCWWEICRTGDTCGLMGRVRDVKWMNSLWTLLLWWKASITEVLMLSSWMCPRVEKAYFWLLEGLTMAKVMNSAWNTASWLCKLCQHVALVIANTACFELVSLPFWILIPGLWDWSKSLQQPQLPPQGILALTLALISLQLPGKRWEEKQQRLPASFPVRQRLSLWSLVQLLLA